MAGASVLLNRLNTCKQLTDRTVVFTQCLGIAMASCRTLMQVRGSALFLCDTLTDAQATELSQLFSIARECLDYAECTVSNEIPRSFSKPQIFPEKYSITWPNPPQIPEEGSPVSFSHKSHILPISLQLKDQSKSSLSTESFSTPPPNAPVDISPLSPKHITPSTETAIPSELQLIQSVRNELDQEMLAKLNGLCDEKKREISQPLIDLIAESEKIQRRHNRASVQLGRSSPKGSQFARRSTADLSLQKTREITELLAISKNRQMHLIRKALTPPPPPRSVTPDGDTPLSLKIAMKNSSVYQAFKKMSDNRKTTKELKKAISKGDEAAARHNVSSIINNPKSIIAKEIDSFASLFNSCCGGSGSNKSLKEAVADIKSFTEETVEKLMKQLELSSDSFFWVCQSVLEQTLFPHIYCTLFALYKSENKDIDLSFFQHCGSEEIGGDITPAHLGSTNRLISEPHSYSPVSLCLHEIPAHITAENKLNTLVAASAQISEIVQNHYEGKGVDADKLLIGADDLIPIFTFCLIQARIRNIHSEIEFMNDFIADWGVMGSSGYSLATIQTCLQFAESLDKKEIEKNLAKVDVE